jgi:DNA-binding transcriptional LysR family regulator
MELRHLAAFVAVAEEANFTRAAERITIAQPAVSQQIRQLEAELGEALFIRDRRGARLTPVGAALLPAARAALAAADGVRQTVAEFRGLLTGRLAVGTVQPLPNRRFPMLLGAFRLRNPQLELTVLEDETDALIESLATGALDLALIGTGPYQGPPADLRSVLFAQEQVVVAASAGHRFAGRPAITLADLRDEPVVTLTSSSRLRSTLEAACREAGFTPRVVAETTDLRLLLDLVAEDIGVALLPGSALRPNARVARIKLTNPTIERRLVLVWRASDLSPAGRAFLHLLEVTSECSGFKGTTEAVNIVMHSKNIMFKPAC